VRASDWRRSAASGSGASSEACIDGLALMWRATALGWLSGPCSVYSSLGRQLRG
jgi:hypothetical protein